jgi:drug/metabolite transporter (DMT)-like permease
MSHIKNKGRATGLALAFTSPFLFAALDVGIRILSADMSIYGLLILRGMIGGVLVLAFARIAGLRLHFAKIGSLALVGLFAALSTACTSAAISQIPLYQAAVILYVYPAFTVVLSMLLRVDKITLRAALGVLTAFVGCVLLVWPDSEAGLTCGIFHAVGVLGAFVYAVSLITIRRLGQGHSGLEPFLAYCVGAIVVSWLLSAAFGTPLGVDSLGEAGQGLALGCLGSLAQLMAFAAVKYLPPFKVGVIGTLEILGTAVASWLIFSDPFTFRAGIGAIIIIYAAFGFQPKKLPESEPREQAA